jgi:V8-like Glu-specific endopeptidase
MAEGGIPGGGPEAGLNTFPEAAVPPGEDAELAALTEEFAQLEPQLWKTDASSTLKPLLNVIARARALGSEGADALKGLADRLRRNRAFDDLYIVTSEMRAMGMADDTVRRWEIQALIELGVYSTAASLARKGIAFGVGTRDGRESYGALGRIYKQLYVDGVRAGDNAHEVLDLHLRRSYAAYARVWESDRTSATAYHGVNALAVAWRAQNDGIPVPRADVARLAADLSAALDKPQNAWDLATRAEVLVAQQRYSEAASVYAAFGLSEGVEPFQLNAALRQLEEVWLIDGSDPVKGEPVRKLKAMLIGKLAASGGTDAGGGKETAQVNISPAEIGMIATESERARQAHPKPAAGNDPKGLEQIFAPNAPTAYSVILNAIDRARAICRIHATRGGQDTAFATGFAVEGDVLCEAWGPDPVIVTNNHVIASRPNNVIQRMELCEAEFFGLDTSKAGQPAQNARVGFSAILWESEQDAHDITILKPNGPLPPYVRPLKELPRFPLPPRAVDDEGIGRVYVIGFPAGGELSFSFADNILLDHDAPQALGATETGAAPTVYEEPEPVRLHYRTPTLGGSSGSPVFDFGDFSLIGVHRAGRMDMPRLNGREGVYAANEGVWIKSVRAAIKESQSSGDGESGAVRRWRSFAAMAVAAAPAVLQAAAPIIHALAPAAPAAAPAGKPEFAGIVGDAAGGASRVAAQVLKEGKAAESEVANIGRESVFGIDDRTRIFETDLSPWRMLCALRCRWNGQLAVGTGFLISPNVVLTAGHVVFPKGIRSRPSSIDVLPGLNGVEQPFGSVKVAGVSIHPNWEQRFDQTCDVAAIILEEPIGQRLGWFGVASRPPDALRLAWSYVSGYPGEKLEQPRDASGAPLPPVQAAQLWHHGSPVLTVNNGRVFYATDTTGGQSGSPIYILDRTASPTPIVIGVHAYGKASTPVGVGDANSGAWISPQLFETIQQWRDQAARMLTGTRA